MLTLLMLTHTHTHTHTHKQTNTLRKLSHRNIIRYEGECHISGNYGLVMELCSGGSLYDAIQDVERELSPLNIHEYSTQIANGMNYLHSGAHVSIVHRDLKVTSLSLSLSLWFFFSPLSLSSFSSLTITLVLSFSSLSLSLCFFLSLLSLSLSFYCSPESLR